MGKAKFARKDKHPPAYAPKVTSIERSKLEEIVGMCADRYKRAHPHPGTQAVVAELKALSLLPQTESHMDLGHLYLRVQICSQVLLLKT